MVYLKENTVRVRVMVARSEIWSPSYGVSLFQVSLGLGRLPPVVGLAELYIWVARCSYERAVDDVKQV